MVDSFRSADSTKIVVTHSFGLHLLPNRLIQAAHQLVIVGGFISFHPDEPAARKRSKRIISLMLEKLSHDPQAVLQDFYRLCSTDGATAEPPLASGSSTRRDQLSRQSVLPDTSVMFSQAAVDRLKNDLSALSEPVHTLRAVSDIQHVVVVHGQRDAVVPVQKAMELNESVAGSTCRIHPLAGHFLPFTDVEFCLEPVAAFIRSCLNCGGHYRYERDSLTVN